MTPTNLPDLIEALGVVITSSYWCHRCQSGSKTIFPEHKSALWNYSRSQDLKILFYLSSFYYISILPLSSCSLFLFSLFPSLPSSISVSVCLLFCHLPSFCSDCSWIVEMLFYLLTHPQLGDWNYLGCLPLLGLFGRPNEYTSESGHEHCILVTRILWSHWDCFQDSWQEDWIFSYKGVNLTYWRVFSVINHIIYLLFPLLQLSFCAVSVI